MIVGDRCNDFVDRVYNDMKGSPDERVLQGNKTGVEPYFLEIERDECYYAIGIFFLSATNKSQKKKMHQNVALLLFPLKWI